MQLIEAILQQIFIVAKPQRKFMSILLTARTYLPGRVNFRNLKRYIRLNEKTFSRWFRRPFNFVEFNLLSLNALLDNGEWVAPLNASFSPKSGRSSYGLDWFGNGSRGQAEHGLEFSLLALVDVTRNTAYTLSAHQTPVLPKAPKLAKESTVNTEAKVVQDADEKPKTNANQTPKETSTTRIESYLTDIKRDTKPLLGKIRYLSLTVSTPRPSLLMGCWGTACTASVSYGMMPICPGYITANKNQRPTSSVCGQSPF